MPDVITSSDERLIRCFTEALGVAPATISDSLAYQSINQWDSISHMSLVAALENEFGVMLDTDEILGLNTFAAAREILRRHDVAF